VGTLPFREWVVEPRGVYGQQHHRRTWSILNRENSRIASSSDMHFCISTAPQVGEYVGCLCHPGRGDTPSRDGLLTYNVRSFNLLRRNLLYRKLHSCRQRT
jgi:hypothetical protein